MMPATGGALAATLLARRSTSVTPSVSLPWPWPSLLLLLLLSSLPAEAAYSSDEGWLKLMLRRRKRSWMAARCSRRRPSHARTLATSNPSSPSPWSTTAAPLPPPFTSSGALPPLSL